MADSIIRLKVESQEYDSKLKRASDGLTRYADECRKVGGTLEVVEKDTLDYVRSLGRMDTASRTATGKLAEMRKAFVELSAQYKQMTDAEKASPFGKALAQSLSQLKTRIGESRTELASINKELGGSKFGQLGGIIDNIGQRFGVTGNLTEMLTSKTALLTGAIGALSAAVVKGGEAWLQYNQQMARQDEITTVTTGLKGADTDRMTDQAKALAQTYGTDFREVINAANTLMTQFGKTGDESMKLLRDGMRGMIHGDGPKLLSMIQQFAPSFQSAGVSAAQLVAVIQNSEGGIFTDQNMQSIVMGIKNIRLMTNATAEALAKVGIDGRQMTKQMNDGSLTVFEALKKVAGALSKVDGNSQAAGDVMQTVFGRMGMTAGTNLGKAIAELNTNLEQTKTQTGEVGKSFDDLYEANVKLNKAIRDAFQYDGWDQMANGIKGKLITALADVVSAMADVRDVAKDTYKWFDYTLGVGNWLEVGSKVADQMAQNMSAAYNVARTLYGFLDKKAAERAAADAANKALEDVGNAGVLPSGAYPKAAEDNRKKEIQDLDTLKRKLKELEEQRRDAVKAGDQVKVSDLTNQINQVKTNIGYLDPNYGKNKKYKAPKISSKYRAGIDIGGVESIDTLSAREAYWKRLQSSTTNSYDYNTAAANLQDISARKALTPMALSLGISVEDADNLKSRITEQLDSIAEGIEPVQINFDVGGTKSLTKDIDALVNTTKNAGSAMNTLGGALSSLEDPSAKVAGIIMQAIGNVALSFSQAMLTPKDPWSWIAFAVAGTATMISTIAAIHSATGYAEGGMIPGNSYSGDNQLARVNAGEIILNRAQQSNVAAALENPTQAAAVSRPSFVRGQDIYLAVNNYLKGSGRGQLALSH